MKKILLASTILAGTAGFAAADNANFTFSGSAYTGLAFTMGLNEVLVGTDFNEDGDSLDTDATAFTPEVSAQFTVGMMTTTDGGLEVGANVTIKAASTSVESDHTEGNFGRRETVSDAMEFDGGIGEGDISEASVYLSGEWGKLTVGRDGTDTYYSAVGITDPTTRAVIDRTSDVDFTYAYSFGDFDIKAWYEYRNGQNNDEYGVQGTYNFADYSIYAGIEYQEDIGVSGDWEAWAGATASMNGFSGAVEAKYRNDTSEWRWKASAAYSMDAWSVGAFVEDDDNGPAFPTDGDLDYGVNASYDLGGGVSVDAAYIFDNDTDVSLAKVGVSMSF